MGPFAATAEQHIAVLTSNHGIPGGSAFDRYSYCRLQVAMEFHGAARVWDQNRHILASIQAFAFVNPMRPPIQPRGNSYR